MEERVDTKLGFLGMKAETALMKLREQKESMADIIINTTTGPNGSGETRLKSVELLSTFFVKCGTCNLFPTLNPKTWNFLYTYTVQKTICGIFSTL